MDVLKTIAIDIKETVFDNETEGIMYITRDSDRFIIAIPVISFSWSIENDKDYNYLLKSNVFGDTDKKERLIKAIKEEIKLFEG